jgi:ubiquinol-cytochrome c reductase cytochrome c1 subunit
VKKILSLIFLLMAGNAIAATTGYPLDKANIDPTDTESLRRGATLFTNYCFNCHSATLMRYNRIGKDLGYDEAQLEGLFIFTGAKVGDLMKIAMPPEDAKRWFYQDDSRPWGVNNAVFKDVAMPHVLWELQGLQSAQYDVHTNEEGVKQKLITNLNLAEPGQLSPEQYDEAVRDIVNFLHYMGEPTKQTRLATGKWVILYLLLFFIVLFFLKKEYWKDVH